MCQNYRVEYHQIIEMDGLRTVFAALRLIVPQSVRTPAAGFDDFLRVESKFNVNKVKYVRVFLRVFK